MDSTRIQRMLALGIEVTLTTRSGRLIFISTLACGDLGLYSTTGIFYSWITLKINGYTVLK